MELNKSIFKWLIITNIITLLLLFGTNIGWFIYESQFEAIQQQEEYTQLVEDVYNVNNVEQSQFK